MYFLALVLLKQLQCPLDQAVAHEQLDRGLLNAHLLQDGDAEPLRDRPVLLLLQDLDDFLCDRQVDLRQVVHTLDGAGDDADQSADGVLEPVGADAQEVHHEVVVFVLRNEEHVVLDELRDQVAPQLGRDLKRVDPQAEQHLDDVLHVVLVLGLDELVLVLGEDRFRKQLGLVVLLQLAQQDLVVLAQLDLVVLDGLPEVVRGLLPVLERVQVLQAVHGDGEDLPG